MNDLQPADFSIFFEAVYGYEPFPWQRMLLERVARDGWPEGIGLPTASGKTACIDVAVFLLAMGSRNGRLPTDHPARRRVFFVVDRRIVVDAAHERAERLAQKLKSSRDSLVRLVADRLRELAGRESSEPLVVSRLRGGTVKDEGWRLSPAQPAVITGTVDQIGSRLLFRGYGSSNLSAPIEAALVACDSLILLDEAHCAVPFMQTARTVQRYAGTAWTAQPIVSPLTFSVLSATLPADAKKVFPEPDVREAALDHPKLRQRIEASKRAELVEAKPKSKAWARGDASSKDELVLDAAQRAINLSKNARRRIAVMVNRVATASEIAAELRRAIEDPQLQLDADVVLMTGRMRPIDRDALVDDWRPEGVEPAENNAGLQHWLGADETPPELSRSIILVTTQCLEVGADFSFDALITECASLDALRQRFGRLNRLGNFDDLDAAVLIRKGDAKSVDKLDDAEPLDPIYGNAIARTWSWLNEHADDEGRVNFAIAALDQALSISKQNPEFSLVDQLNAPSLDAPVMLPAHVDLLCQTAPQPVSDPDAAVFLHGRQYGVPETHVVFRADLVDTEQADWRKKWCDAVALLPPLTSEALSVPLWLVRKWLADRPTVEQFAALSDSESQQAPAAESEEALGQPFVLWRWRGRRRLEVSRKPKDVQPNDTIVVPAHRELAGRLGHAFCRPEGTPLDIAEHAYQSGRNHYVLRLLTEVYNQHGMPAGLSEIKPLKALFEWGTNEDRELSDLKELLSSVNDYARDVTDVELSLPRWLSIAIGAFAQLSRPRVSPHPAGGVVLTGVPVKDDKLLPDLDFGDINDSLSAADEPIELSKHTEHVVRRATAWAERCLPTDFLQAMIVAAELHDIGKADPRFQIILHGDELEAAIHLAGGKLLAKSDGLYRPPEVQRRLRSTAGLPENFRHEMLSIQLAESNSERLSGVNDWRELVLHLIASHHGYGRPFAPVCRDDNAPGVVAWPNRQNGGLTAEQRRQLIPSHRLDSGVAERFWKLTRRYGWWGLAYLEAVLRLADRAASAAEAVPASKKKQEVFQ